MKKIVGTIAAAALVAASAFADVGIGSWGRAIFAPISDGDGDGNLEAFTATSWNGLDGGSPRVGISIHGESENVGFNIDMNADNGSAGIGDTAYFWAKPWEWLEVKIGKVQDDTGRGNACFGLFDLVRVGGGWIGEDYTFTRFGAKNGFTEGGGGQGKGAIVKITPIENLWIIGSFDLKDFTNVDAYTVFAKNSSYGAGYTIDGIGSIRAKVAGIEDGIFNAAFDLTAVENLYLTVGVFVPFTSKNQLTIAAYANYRVAIATLHAMYHFTFANDNKDAKSMVGVGADFDLGNGYAINADVRVNLPIVADTGDIAFLAGVKKGLTNGYIGLGFEGDVGFASGSKFTWCVPVVISAWF